MHGCQIFAKAASFAAEKHTAQRRKCTGDVPYINHPLAVADLIANVGQEDNPILLAAAVLHDTLEDTKTTPEELQQEFGNQIMLLVQEVSDNKALSKVERKKLQIEHARKASRWAKVIKLADKLHNLRSLMEQPPVAWTPDIVQGYFVWSKCVVDAMRGTNAPLEAELDKLFMQKLPPDGNLEEALQEYYRALLA